MLAPGGFFLVEIKSRPGMLDGDAHTWIWRDQGRETLTDNPLLLTNRKAKRLISLLKQQRAVSKMRLPFLEPIVFCSAPGLQVRLHGPAASGVRVRDKDQTGARPDPIPGIIATLTRPPSMDPGQVRIDANVARAIVRALEQAGVRRSQKARRVGDYQLGRLMLDGPAFQDFEATHVAMPNVARRVRIYQIPRGAGADTRQMIVRAAQREFQILEGINHPAILRAIDYKDQELGRGAHLRAPRRRPAARSLPAPARRRAESGRAPDAAAAAGRGGQVRAREAPGASRPEPAERARARADQPPASPADLQLAGSD